MENKGKDSVLRSKKIVYEKIADLLSSAQNYDIFREGLQVALSKSFRSIGIFQAFMETKVPAMAEMRKKETVGRYIQELIIDSVADDEKTNIELICGIKQESNAIAQAWNKNRFLFEDCAASEPGHIETYVDLIDKKFDLESFEYPRYVVAYKKFLQNERHDKYNAGETDILNSQTFLIRTGEKENTPNWDLSNYKDCFFNESSDFEQ